jgi:hypothetical protein
MATFLEIARSKAEQIRMRRETEQAFAALRITPSSFMIPSHPSRDRRSGNKGGVKDPICLCGARRSVHDKDHADYCEEFRRAAYQPDACHPLASDRIALRKGWIQ